MISFSDLALATHIEVLLALGGSIVIEKAVYLAWDELPEASRARALSRREVIRRRARKPRRAS